MARLRSMVTVIGRRPLRRLASPSPIRRAPSRPLASAGLSAGACRGLVEQPAEDHRPADPIGQHVMSPKEQSSLAAVQPLDQGASHGERSGSNGMGSMQRHEVQDLANVRRRRHGHAADVKAGFEIQDRRSIAAAVRYSSGRRAADATGGRARTAAPSRSTRSDRLGARSRIIRLPTVMRSAGSYPTLQIMASMRAEAVAHRTPGRLCSCDGIRDGLNHMSSLRSSASAALGWHYLTFTPNCRVRRRRPRSATMALWPPEGAEDAPLDAPARGSSES